MSLSVKLQQIVPGALGSIPEKIFTGDELKIQSFQVPASSTDHHRTLDIDFSKLQLLYIVADQPILMEWNDANGTQGSFTLNANVPFVQMALGVAAYFAPLIDEDVTDLYFSSDSATNVTIVVLQNNTP